MQNRNCTVRMQNAIRTGAERGERERDHIVIANAECNSHWCGERREREIILLLQMQSAIRTGAEGGERERDHIVIAECEFGRRSLERVE